METVNILCTKWGSKYGADYVNRLRSMVGRNMSRPFRFVCLTDDPEGLGPDVETFPFPQLGVAPIDEREPWALRFAWLKVAVFASPLYDLTGPTLCLDLDVIISGSLDPFFDHPGDFVVIKEWDKRDITGNTSVFRFEAGRHGDLLRDLNARLEEARRDFRNEQEYVSDYFSRAGLLSYWPPGWCVSFKRHCMPRGPAGWFRPATIPEGARVIVFHGRPNPDDVIAGRSGKWYRRVIPVDWVEDLWR